MNPPGFILCGDCNLRMYVKRYDWKPREHICPKCLESFKRAAYPSLYPKPEEK